MRRSEFGVEMRERIERQVRPGQVIATLGIGRPNRVASIDERGVWVETEQSMARQTGPQLVPAWMITIAWEHLRRHGRLSSRELLNDLNVKRSAFVCALLSHLPEVEVESSKPIVLRLRVTVDGQEAQTR
jgi:hypothetical protein